ncbi:MAG: phosphoribosyltransferase, partial [Nitrosomonas sp.]|nr:phosphoribosyltransferase [Nitrosomonas sp.]
MIFADRIAAARNLAEALSDYRDKHPLVLAIPRGAVPMAKVIAQQLNGEMDVVLVRKLRAPGNPEFAIGSVDESGWV